MTGAEKTEVIRLMDRVEALRQAERETADQRDMEHSRRVEVERELEEAQAELATANEVIRQIAERFGISDVRHILGELAEVQADNARMRTTLAVLVSEVCSLLEAQSIGVKRYATMWPSVLAAREALKGGE